MASHRGRERRGRCEIGWTKPGRTRASRAGGKWHGNGRKRTGIAQSRDLASAQRSRETPVTFNDIPISYASAATALRHLDEW